MILRSSEGFLSSPAGLQDVLRLRHRAACGAAWLSWFKFECSPINETLGFGPNLNFHIFVFKETSTSIIYNCSIKLTCMSCPFSMERGCANYTSNHPSNLYISIYLYLPLYLYLPPNNNNNNNYIYIKKKRQNFWCVFSSSPLQ
jgi:hypothetical protein